MPSRASVHTPAHAWYRKPDTRPPSSQRGYSWRWAQYSKAYLIANPVCARCAEPATCVDHIEPVTSADDPRFWLEENHQPMCQRCHSQKTMTEDRKKGRRAAK